MQNLIRILPTKISLNRSTKPLSINLGGKLKIIAEDAGSPYTAESASRRWGISHVLSLVGLNEFLGLD